MSKTKVGETRQDFTGHEDGEDGGDAERREDRVLVDLAAVGGWRTQAQLERQRHHGIGQHTRGVHLLLHMEHGPRVAVLADVKSTYF